MHGTQKKARAKSRRDVRPQASSWLGLKQFYLLPASVLTIWGCWLSLFGPCNPRLQFLLTIDCRNFISKNNLEFYLKC